MIGILHHPKIAASEPVAKEIAHWLAQRGEPAWTHSTWDEAFIVAHIERCRLLVVIGGDGSVLRAARLAAPFKVPIFTVNMGRLGFLSEAEPDAWQDKLAAVLDDKHWLERRIMLKAEVVRADEIIATRIALNDVVVSRGAQARVLRIRLDIDHDYVTSYVADGVIFSTPTGSTAYALAAGGPILPPGLLNYLIVPVAPHLSLDRTLVLQQEAVASIRVSMDHEATLTVDGQDDTVMLEDGDCIRVQASSLTSLFARVGSPTYFYRRLMSRLRYGIDAEPAGGE